MPDGNQNALVLKLLLIGNSNVGKSSILLRFTEEVFLGPDEATSTIGVDFKVKHIERDGKRYKLTIWDTAGQERFRTLTSSYYRGAQGILLVYDVTSRSSFTHLDNWIKELETYTASKDVVKMVVGNKTDKEASRMVSRQEGQDLAARVGALWVECSAKKGDGVEQAFDSLVEKIIDTPSLYRRQPGGGIGKAPGTVKVSESEDSWSNYCAC